MKKVIYSIVSALILSVIFALIFPTWFLNDGARWTYLNDSARMDIFISGNVKNGRVQVGGGGMRITQPKWLSGSNFQGTMVEIPVSYRQSSYQIKLTSQADAAGQDATLVIKFLGNLTQNQGKRMPAQVIFRNLTFNGKLIAEEKTVWHDQPFRLQRPFHPPESITLAFDVQKPLGASDFSYVNLFATLFVFLILCLSVSVSLKTAVNHALEYIDRRDIVRALSDGYTDIDPVYRRSFWIIFGVLCFAFGFHAIHFMWGNNDWSRLDSVHRWLESEREGRYMLNSTKASFSNGVVLPIIYDFITFVALALNAVLLSKYWRLEKRVSYYVLCGLVLTAQPFTLCMLYYAYMIPEVFIGVTCALAALLLSEKVAVSGGSATKTILYFLIAVVLINFSLAMYPVFITTIAVAFVGRLLVQSFDWDGSWGQLKSYMKPFVMTSTVIILGIAFYKLIITFVFPTGIGYNTDTLPPDQVPGRVRVLFRQCFYQLYEYNYPFISQWILWVFLGFTVMLVLYICFTGNLRQKAVRFILLLGSLFATQTSMLIAKMHIIDGRIELFGLVFYEVLAMILVIACFRRLHNLWVITGACVIFASIINDLDCLRVWKLGFEAEKMLWNRTLARLEIQKEFNPTAKYDFVLIGEPIAMRPRYYTGPWKKFHFNALSLLNYPYQLASHPFVPHEFYYPTRFRRNGFSIFHKNNPDYIARLRQLYQAGVLQKAEVWPKANGLIVWKDIILIVTDGKELENYKKQFERESGKK